MYRRCAIGLFGIALVSCLGCQVGGAAERFGKIYYLDGAGNWGDGSAGVTAGLRAAGYCGDVEHYIWTTSYNPLVDQLNVVAAKFRATELARRIEAYHRHYPGNPIHVVALSAGTGVAAWAIEQLQGDVVIENFVLLGSSLSHDYDVTQALARIRGKVYIYYSPHDCVLDKVRTIGTIDGKRGVDSAGLAGLTPPPNFENRIVNIKWSRDWLRYGWTGAHADCTNPHFVRHVIAPALVEPSGAARAKLAAAAPE